jgi:DNA-binding NarL/FixJ family response regulator
MSLIRILLVDDYEPWRRFVALTVQKEPQLQIVCEASDGLEAIERAEELQPDLIFMDIALPKLNGIDAARKIGNLAPKAKILFLSQESSGEVVREALMIGTGFVLKLDAGKELLSATKAVSLDRKFLSSRLASHIFSEAADGLVPIQREGVLSPVRSVEL